MTVRGNGQDSSATGNFIPPDDHLEQILLAALLADNRRLDDVGALTADHFERDAHGRTFNLIRLLVSQGLPATPQTMAYMVKGDPVLGNGFLGDLANSTLTSTPAAVAFWSRELMALATMRSLLALGNDLGRVALGATKSSMADRVTALRGEFENILKTWQDDKPSPREPIGRINWTGLEGLTAPRQEWIVPSWVPCGETTLVGGPGGHGKTLLIQQMCTGLVLGREWMGIELKETPSYLVLCEDKHNDVWRRQENINHYYGCTMPDLWAMSSVPRREAKNNRLMIFDRDGNGHLTEFFDQLLEDVLDWGAKLVVLDTLADLFLGDMNNADQARTFVRQCCDKIAEAIDGAVILIYHPSRTGEREGHGEYGSVQWNAAARSRLYHCRPEPEDGKDPDPYARVLTRMKSNFAEPGVEIKMKWEEGVLIRSSPLGGTDRKARNDKAVRVFLTQLRKIREEGQHVTNATAARVMAGRPDCEGLHQKELEQAMKTLFVAKRIKMDDYREAGRVKREIAEVAINRAERN